MITFPIPSMVKDLSTHIEEVELFDLCFEKKSPTFFLILFTSLVRLLKEITSKFNPSNSVHLFSINS